MTICAKCGKTVLERGEMNVWKLRVCDCAEIVAAAPPESEIKKAYKGPPPGTFIILPKEYQ